MAERLLLDTHVVLWLLAGDPRLGAATVALVQEADEVFVSAASAWEVAIKAALGRLTLPEPFEVGVRRSGFDELPVRFTHAREVSHLPSLHQDPFDRLLVATALADGLTLVSADPQVLAYPVSRFDARR